DETAEGGGKGAPERLSGPPLSLHRRPGFACGQELRPDTQDGLPRRVQLHGRGRAGDPGPAAGGLRHPATDSLDENRLYVSNENICEAGVDTKPDSSRIWTTCDFGQTWSHTYSKLVTNPVNTGKSTCKADPDLFVTYIASSTNAVYSSTLSGQVLRSLDHGLTWKAIGGANVCLPIDTRLLGVVDDNIVFLVDTLGNIWRTLNSGGDSVKSSDIIPPASADIRFTSSRIINSSFNITIHLPIFLHHSGTMNDVDMIMHYPTQSLKLTGTSLYNGKTFDVSGSEWPGRTALHLAAADLNAAPDSLLGYVNFLWTPLEFDCDEIAFDSIDTHSTEAPCSGPLSALPFKGIIGSYSTCGAAAVPAHDSRLPIVSIHPNPATSTVTVELSGFSGLVQYELFDVLGKSRKHGTITGSSSSLDVSGLGAGSYYFRLSFDGAHPITKRVLIIN
ncbi:MAG: T9SS type A sorting domain-containing protein, partial [Bacteroidota bacterium]|nr:T9SS type A sorting domain-containing protein [Bacteroidota bacterium]